LLSIAGVFLLYDNKIAGPEEREARMTFRPSGKSVRKGAGMCENRPLPGFSPLGKAYFTFIVYKVYMQVMKRIRENITSP